MNKFTKIFSLMLLLFSLSNCSFDKKSGIWTGSEKEKRKISNLEKNGKIINISAIKSDKYFTKEINPKKPTKLISAQKNLSWPTADLSFYNLKGNLYYPGSLKILFKKKAGKNTHDYTKVITSPIIYNETILFADNNGSIFNISNSGKINWKQNIYKKINKKIYKNISHAFYNEVVYISDNIGYLYALNSITGEVIWKINYGIPFKSHINLFDKKIYLIDQENKIICFDAKEGKVIWESETGKSFIKSQSYLALALSKKKHTYSINSSGDLNKMSSKDGRSIWSIPTLNSLVDYESDFFETSNIVIDENKIFFSNTTSNTYSVDIENGFLNWQNEAKSSITPIVSGKNVFVLTNNGYLVNIDKESGEIIWSIYILEKIKFKKSKKNIISGFVLGSEKIYATTTNGYLIVCSAESGKAISYKKIANKINSSPIISNGMLYILTGNSKIIAFK